ncbi:hypothetical protein LCGC14_0804250 [marine sediment metagenome]|uniref:Uncharacterized protein n=1 Tax=marine sediment metagenome TaxID=412755 RepID=A0A0F9PTA4_9ZZZZ
MEDIQNFLNKFLKMVKIEVFDYYDRSQSYLKDLISYKNVNLKKQTKDENEEILKETLEKILKAIKTGLNTIGVPIHNITMVQTTFLNDIHKKGNVIDSYGSYLELYFKDYINPILFTIIIEYIFDIEVQKFENLKLFKLIPHNFIGKLNVFKEKNIATSEVRSYFIQNNFDDVLDFTKLTLKKGKSQINIIDKERSPLESEKGKKSVTDILTRLEKAKMNSIERLKSPKNKIIKIDTEILPSKPQPENKPLPQPKLALPTIEQNKKALNYLTILPIVNPDLAQKFNIDIGNLLNSRVINPDLLDLENLYYYISILKMLRIEFPYTFIEIKEILKKYVRDKIFSSSTDSFPDSINIFHGLSILNEFNLITNSNIIDIDKTEKFLKSKLKIFVPEKLKMNYYTLLSLIILENSEFIKENEEDYLNRISKLNILSLENSNPISDIYHIVAFIKLLDKSANLPEFKTKYLNELKTTLNSQPSSNSLITETAKTLLLLDFLDVKNQETILVSHLLKEVITTTIFFNLESLDIDFNWRNDKLAYKIELKMVFWILLACSQYSTLNLVNL